MSGYDPDPAPVSFRVLFDIDNSCPGISGIYCSRTGDRGDPEIRGGIKGSPFYAYQFQADSLSGFQCSSLYVQVFLGDKIQFFIKAKTCVRVEKAADQEEREKKEQYFFHIGMPFDTEINF